MLATTLGLVAFRALAAEPASPAVEVKFFLNPTTVLDAHHQPNHALRTAFQVAAEPVTIRMQLAATHAEDFKTRVTQHDRENTFPFENVAAMKASGYTNMTVPAELGGGGVPERRRQGDTFGWGSGALSFEPAGADVSGYPRRDSPSAVCWV